MLSILVILATSITAPINAIDSGVDYSREAFFNFSVIVQQGEVVTVSLYDDRGLIEQRVFDYPGVFTDRFDLGYFNGSVDTHTWHATCTWVDGTPPSAVAVHYFSFPEDFHFAMPYKVWVHGHHF